eukprot:185013-Rhodomonas_salina.2
MRKAGSGKGGGWERRGGKEAERQRTECRLGGRSEGRKRVRRRMPVPDSSDFTRREGRNTLNTD